MQPYSKVTARPQAEIMAPMSQSVRLRPMLCTDLRMLPGVANMPLPITREIIRM